MTAVAAVAVLLAGALGALAQERIWTESRRTHDIARVPSLAPLAKEAMPAVVTVFTRRNIKGFFFFIPQEYTEQGSGSGFIISNDGYIVTNYHVVRGSDGILVAAGVDRKTEYKAELVGADPETDIALIKVEASGLPVLPLGDSDELKVGDWVAAIGSPFNFPHTLTVGVVSAKGRRLGIGNYDDFIQTDASINSGNSGGPLLNLRGEAVGVNTLIVSPSGGNIGIGFATPVNLVKSILPQLREKGEVIRSWLGVSVVQVGEEAARKNNMDEPGGALVTRVAVGSPADKAGLRVGDVITRFAGRNIVDSSDLPSIVSSYGVGKKAKVEWIRDGVRQERTIELEKLPTRQEMAQQRFRGGADARNPLGVAVRDLRKDDVTRLGLTDERGVLVVSVDPQSPAAQQGISPDDVIIKINMTEIHDVSDFNRAVARLGPGQLVKINLRRGPAAVLRVFRMPRY